MRRPTIGLVGGIGSGKSAVAEAWGQAGCLVAHSDAMAREALADPAIRAELLGWWGSGVLDSKGAIDRAAVARIVFADPLARKRLEALVHPWIEARRRAAFAAAPASAKAFVIDAPLLLEVGLDRECDAVVFVDAPEAARLERVRRSRGWDAAELHRREAAQWPLERKLAAADFVLRNDSDLDSLRTAAGELLERMLRDIEPD